MTPMEVFDVMRDRALTMLKASFMESERDWPGDDSPEVQGLLMPVLGIGIAAATEYLAANPEHLALAGAPICTSCRESIQTLQVGVDPDPSGDSTVVVKVAWPCGHRQS